MDFLLRDKVDADEPFIYSSFLKSYKQHSTSQYIPNSIYYKYQTEIVKHLLTAEKTIVSVFPEDANEIIAYMVFNVRSDILILHFLYVKPNYRNKHIGSDIVKSFLPLKDNNTIIATHITDNFKTLKYTIPNTKIIYDPFILQSNIFGTSI